LIQNIGKFIYRVQISDRYFINFADASALITPSFANTYGYGKRINDPEMMALGAWSAALQDVSQKGVTESFSSPTRVLPALFSLPEILGIDASLPLPRDVFLETIEVFVARDQAGSTDGFFVAAKGGHNAESHNHNDIGHVVVYTDGGIEYQYDIAARNVSHQSNDQSVEFTLDIAKAYPPEANIETWVRSVCFNRGQDIILTDRYHLKAVTGDLTFNLLTACHPETVGPGVLALRETALADGRVSGTAQIQYDADLLDVTFEPVPIEDSRLKTVWGDRLTRIVLTVKTPSTQGVWTVRITS
jgi:hypothetical protein